MTARAPARRSRCNTRTTPRICVMTVNAHPLALRESVARAQRQHQLAHRLRFRHAGLGAAGRSRHGGRSPALSPSTTTACCSPARIGQTADSGGLFDTDGPGGPRTALDHGSAVPGLPFVNGCELRRPCLIGFERQRRGAHLRPRRADARLLVQRAVGHHRESAHHVRRAVHQGARPTTTTSWSRPTAWRRSTTRTDSNGTPKVALSPAPNVNYAAGFLANPHNYWMQFIQDHWENNDADEVAARADRRIRPRQRRLARLAEGRRALRRPRAEGALLDATTGRRSRRPGAATARASTSTTPRPRPIRRRAATPAPSMAIPRASGKSVSLAGSLRRQRVSERRPDGVPEPLHAARLRPGTPKALADRNVNAPQGWNPLCDRTANVPGEGCFTQSEILDVTEKSKAAYFMLRFGGPEAMLGSVNVVGNVGVPLREDRRVESRPGRLPDCATGTPRRWRPARAPVTRATTPRTRPPTSSAGSRRRCWHSAPAPARTTRSTRATRTCCRASTCASGSPTSSSCASAIRRACRGRTSACCATRCRSTRRRSMSATARRISSATRRAQVTGLQLHLLGRSRLRGPRTGRSRQLRPVVRGVLQQEQLVHFRPVLQEARERASPTDAPIRDIDEQRQHAEQ